MKKALLACGTALLFATGANAATINDFEGVSPLDGWHNGNSWTVVDDGTGNNVLDTSTRAGNRATGVALPFTVDVGESASLVFDFYLQDTTSADLGVGLTDLTDITGTAADSSDALSPYLRIVDGKLQAHDGSFGDVEQAIVIETWYTITMTADNSAARSWTATIEGGAYGSATALTVGGDSTFAFRDPTAGDLVNFMIRGNNNNGASGAYIDNISLVPEPGSLALLGLGTLCMLGRSRRRSA